MAWEIPPDQVISLLINYCCYCCTWDNLGIYLQILKVFVVYWPVDSLFGLMETLWKSKVSNMTLLEDVLYATSGHDDDSITFSKRPSSIVTSSQELQ